MSSIRRSRCSGFAFALKLILGLTALSALAACGASSNAETSTTSLPSATATAPSSATASGATAPATAAPPLVVLKASESTVAMGTPVTLQWNATNAKSCAASGGWSGTMPTTGSTTTPPLSAQTSYTLTCSGTGGTTTQSVAVSVAEPAARPAPSIALAAAPTTVSNGGSSTLTWKSSEASACTASGGWHGSVPTSGTWSTGALTNTTEYELTCTGAGGSATQSATVTVSGKAPTVTLSASPTHGKSRQRFHADLVEQQCEFLYRIGGLERLQGSQRLTIHRRAVRPLDLRTDLHGFRRQCNSIRDGFRHFTRARDIP